MATKSLQATIFGVDQASPVFKKVSGSADQMADDAEKSGSRFGSAFSKGAKLAAGALAAVGFAQFAKDTIAQASAMEQNAGAMQAVFKDTSGEIERFGQTSASTVGIAKQDYYQLAAVFGSQLKNMGVASDELAPKTNQLVTLGADLAAVYGGSASDAVEAISSLLRGERDPIERYGVSIKQASIDAYEMANGLDTSTAAAKTHSDMVATLALLFDQTADAQGQFAAQTDTLAESQQIATAKFKEAQAEIGAKLLPIITDLTNVAGNDLVPVLGFVADGLGAVVTVVDAIPGPVKIALAALVGFKLFEQTAVFSKLAGGLRGFREEMQLQQGLAAMGGQELSNWGAAAQTAKIRSGALAKTIGKGGLLAGGIFVVSEIADEFGQLAENTAAAESAATTLGDTLSKSGGKWTDEAREQQRALVEQSDAFNTMIKLGISYSDVMSGMTGDADAFGRLMAEVGQKSPQALFDVYDAAVKLHGGVTTNAQDLGKQKAAFLENEAAAKGAAQQQSAYVDQLLQQHAVATGAAKSADQLNKEMAENEAAAKGAAQQQSAYVDQLLRHHDEAVRTTGVDKEVARQAQQTAAKVRDTARAMQEANDKTHDLTSRSTELEAALARLAGREPDVEEATRSFNGALQQAISSARDGDGKIRALGKGVIAASGEINTATKAGQDLYDSVTQMAKGAQDAALAQAELTGKTRGQKAAEDAAVKSLEASRGQFIANAKQMGLTADQAKRLADRYFGIPKNIKTVIKGDFRDIDAKLQRLADTTTVIPVKGQYMGTVGGPARSSGTIAHASGGAVLGPGPKGVDSLLRVLAPGEHVLTTRDVDAMGGQAGVYAFRRALHRGVSGMAAGGAVGDLGASLSPLQLGQPVVQVTVQVPGGFVGSATQLAEALAPAIADAVDRGKRKGTIRAGAFV